MDDYEISLDDHVASAIDTYRGARNGAWSVVENGKQYLEIADRVAATILAASRDLVARDPWAMEDAWRALRRIAEDDSLAAEVKSSLQIELAEELVPQTAAMAERCLSVTRAVLLREPNESVLRFVRRLTRCYIAGFLPECVMLCRAALENSVTEVMNRRGLRAVPNAQGGVRMGSRLDALQRAGLLSTETRNAARTVWTRGNAAVHKDPTLVQEVAETIDLTVRVLIDLYRSPPPPTGSPLPVDA